jgi:hypothetical protein
MSAGMSPNQVLDELPDLEGEDISACLRFASRRLDHPISSGLTLWLDNQPPPGADRVDADDVAYCLSR